MGKKKIFELLQTLKDLEEMELTNAAKIYTIAYISTHTPVEAKPKPKKLKG